VHAGGGLFCPRPDAAVAGQFAWVWEGISIYFLAPCLGMLATAALMNYLSLHPRCGTGRVSDSQAGVCLIHSDLDGPEVRVYRLRW
jgi:hypothetical protein